MSGRSWGEFADFLALPDVATNVPDIEAIRKYLESEAARFGSGDYSGSLKIEGKDIPSAQYLKAVAPGQMSIIYRNVGSGAAIDYVGRDKASADAIHAWFDALLSDGEGG